MKKGGLDVITKMLAALLVGWLVLILSVERSLEGCYSQFLSHPSWNEYQI